MEQAIAQQNQSRVARLNEVKSWAQRYKLYHLVFAAGGLAVGATLAAVPLASFPVVLATAAAEETVTVSAWRPPPPPRPGITDLNLTARLLPVPAATRRDGFGG